VRSVGRHRIRAQDLDEGRSLAHFGESRPNVDLEIVLEATRRANAALVADEVDVAIVTDPPREATYARAQLAVSELVAIASPDHPVVARAKQGALRWGALADCELLVFDIAERGAYPAYDESRVEGVDWSVIAIKESDGTHLTRRVLTFRANGETMRRTEEVHTLELYDRAEMKALLREHGFRVQVRRSYGTRRLPKGHAVYVCVRR